MKPKKLTSLTQYISSRFDNNQSSLSTSRIFFINFISPMSVHSQKIVMHRFDASGYYDSNRQPMNTKQNKGLSMGWTLIAIVKKRCYDWGT